VNQKCFKHYSFMSIIKIIFVCWFLKSYILQLKLYCTWINLHFIPAMPKKINKNYLIIYKFDIIFNSMTKKPLVSKNNKNAIILLLGQFKKKNIWCTWHEHYRNITIHYYIRKTPYFCHHPNLSVVEIKTQIHLSLNQKTLIFTICVAKFLKAQKHYLTHDPHHTAQISKTKFHATMISNHHHNQHTVKFYP